MFIEEIQQHLAVSSIAELEKSLKLDAGVWNLISIREPWIPRPDFVRYAKRVHEVLCEDKEKVSPDSTSRPPRVQDVIGILGFVDAYPGEPLLIHCLAGLSRSTAVALALILRGMMRRPGEVTVTTSFVDRAVKLLLQIRPRARPNLLFLQLFLEQFLTRDQAQELTLKLGQHPTFLENSALPGRDPL